MENKRRELVPRNINEESIEAEYMEDVPVEKMCTCDDDVVEQMVTLKDDDTYRSLSAFGEKIIYRGVPPFRGAPS